MLSRTREKLAQEAATWRHLGLIDDTLAATLAERYEARQTGGLILLRWLGLFGISMVAASVFGGVASLAGEISLFLPALMLGGAAWATWRLGARLTLDARGRHPILGSALLTVGLAGGYGALTLLYAALGGERHGAALPWLLVLTGTAALATAYRFRLRWPLLLGLLLFFHGVGSWHAYAGRGSYLLAIADERVMATVAAATVALGLWHERAEEREALARHLGFGSLYIVFGLLYVNLSLWILSLWPGGLGWVLAFTAAGIGQLVVGARLVDGRFTGFGVVFLGIDLYTRLFEHFWDRLSAGIFFLVAGTIALVLGGCLERLANAAPQSPAPRATREESG